MENIIKVGIGVVIESDGKILLGHRCAKATDTGGIYEPDSWTLPGGKQEYNETILEGGAREVKEETDLDVSELEVIGASDDISSDRHFITIHVVASKCSGNVKVMEKDKIDKWEWFDLENLPDNVYSPSVNSIKAYLKWRG